MEITECEAYKKLISAVEADRQKWPGVHNYLGKLAWVLDRAKHYAEKTGLDACDILNSWEKERSYWYMNFYQDANQPLIEDGKVRVFETLDELHTSIGENGFRCPFCGGVSKSPYECDSGIKVGEGKSAMVCDWKSYGLFRCMGKGIYIFVKSEMRGDHIFMPVSYEEAGHAA